MASYVDYFTDSKIKVVHNDRVAFTTDGKLVNLLPATYDYSGTIACIFADPPKSANGVYMHQAFLDNTFVSGVGYVWARGSRCVAWVGVKPREWSQETTICALPSPDVDFLVVKASFSRTSAPSHTWCGKSIKKMIKENVTIPFTGSVHLESGDPGLQRIVTPRISGGNLVLHQKESIVDTNANFGNWTASGAGGYSAVRTDWRKNPDAGLPVWADTGSPWRRNDADSRPDSFIAPPFLTTCDLGNSQQCSIPSDPTNYGSQWNITLNVMFGVTTKAS